MSVYVGSVSSRASWRWVNRDSPVVLGNDAQTMSGDYVMITPHNVSQAFRPAKLSHDWLRWQDVQILMAMWRSRNVYTMKPERELDYVYTIRFAADNGVEPAKHVVWGDDVPKGDLLGARTNRYAVIINVFLLG